MVYAKDFLERIEQLNSIGIALSVERDHTCLLEKILEGAQALTNADGGTLYLVDDEKYLRFEIVRTISQNIAYGGSKGSPVPYDPIPLYIEGDVPDTRTIAAYSVLSGQIVNIADAYSTPGFDFSGTHAFDEQMSYRSRSLLSIPMRNQRDEVIGVLQLINAETVDGEPTVFTPDDQRLVESLASQAAIALTNQTLNEDLRNLLEKFIEVIANAIDEKSPYTGGHCRRVPDIAMLMAEAIQNIDRGPLAEEKFSEEQLYELKIAALLHDCGKITTPVHVVDKATKLETIFDRIHLVHARLEILSRDAEIELLQTKLQHDDDASTEVINAHKRYEDISQDLDEIKAVLTRCNVGSEFMPDEAQEKIKEIGSKYHLQFNNEKHPLLTEEEIYNLCIPKGTLTIEERKIINNHITTTINMLESLPFPKHLKNVPEIAGGHHERMDGKGYPKGLKRDEMSVQARLMGIADIFEALTAADRPYKKAMPLSQAITILGKMKEEQHIDPDLFDVFIAEKVYLKYAEMYLKEEQIDEINLDKIPGYTKI